MICFSVMLFMSGTASSSWNCMPARPISAYFFIFSSSGMLLRWPGPKVSLPSWFHGPAVKRKVAIVKSSCLTCSYGRTRGTDMLLPSGSFCQKTAALYLHDSEMRRLFNAPFAFFTRQSCDFYFFGSLPQICSLRFVLFDAPPRGFFCARYPRGSLRRADGSGIVATRKNFGGKHYAHG